MSKNIQNFEKHVNKLKKINTEIIINDYGYIKRRNLKTINGIIHFIYYEGEYNSFIEINSKLLDKKYYFSNKNKDFEEFINSKIMPIID
jgi:hypothetical protein